MPESQIYDIRPLGWEDDPEEESLKVSSLDYLSVWSYCPYAVFIKLEEEDKHDAVAVLKEALARTLSQARHLCGVIEKDPEGGHSFVRRRGDTVQFVVQRLDGDEEDGHKQHFPSFDGLARAHYTGAALGDNGRWLVAPMSYGLKPEAHPDNRPVVSAFKANFVRGGLVLVMHNHHYANDAVGWNGLVRQLAENCVAIHARLPAAHLQEKKKKEKKTLEDVGDDGSRQLPPFPSWDPANLDASRFTKPEIPEHLRVDAPPLLLRREKPTGVVELLFHLPKTRAAELKRLAAAAASSSSSAPTTTLDAGGGPNGSIDWLSTYDAFTAFTWQTMSRLRAPMYKPDPEALTDFMEGVELRSRLRDPAPLPPRTQRNVMLPASAAALLTPEERRLHQPTARELSAQDENWARGLARAARFVRRLTNSATAEAVDHILGAVVAPARDKSRVAIGQPGPMALLITDHRPAGVAGLGFGFGAARAYRLLCEAKMPGLVVVYAPLEGEDEGPELSVMIETALSRELIEDPLWNEFFEYRGVQGEEGFV